MLRSVFLALSRNRFLRRLAERSKLGRRMSGRFVAGMSVEEAIAVCRQLNEAGMSVSLDCLGESVTNEAQARQGAAVYHRLLDIIQTRRLRANVSVKLTQVGMDIDPLLAEEIVTAMAEHAAMVQSFVRIDMEGSAHTEATLELTERVHARPGLAGSVGTVLQSYLKRSEADTQRLLNQKIRIRLCKGAYKEPAAIAFAKKSAVDANYMRLMKRMASFQDDDGRGVFCGIATHDEALIDEMKRFVGLAGLSKNAFEFQMLYGIRRDLQEQLVREGFAVRVYVPFGPEWYPYFMRRLAERPANLLFLLKNFSRA